MKLAFHHLTGYDCFPGASDGKYLILPFKALTPPNDNHITFLGMSLLKEESEQDKNRISKFPYEFSFLFHPVKKNSDKGYKWVGQVTFVPGKRSSLLFIAVLSTIDKQANSTIKPDICLFVIDPPTEKNQGNGIVFLKSVEESTYLTKFIELDGKKNEKNKNISYTSQPTKVYKCEESNDVIKIFFLSDDRHFLVVTKKKVLMYNIESEDQFDTKVIFPDNFIILNCDFRNDILLILVETTEDGIKNQEMMFFYLQEKQIFNIKKGSTPSFSIFIKKKAIKGNYPGINLIYNSKTCSEDKFTIHDTIHTDSAFTIYGCKFLPGDNNFISIILYEEERKYLFVYFFKIDHQPQQQDILLYDKYEINSIQLVQEDEIYKDIQRSFNYDIEKSWYDISGCDDEFEFIFMFFPQIIVRFHYISIENSQKSSSDGSTSKKPSPKKTPTVQFIDVKYHREEKQVIVPDQQTENLSFQYLPSNFKTKSQQLQAFSKNKYIKLRWLTILGGKPSTEPCILFIDSVDRSCAEQVSQEHSGFRTYATKVIDFKNNEK